MLHVGDTVSGSYAWGFSPTRSGRFHSAGAGLRLQRCSGDKVAGLGSSGSRTCSWKATSATGGWVTSLGMTLFQNASLGAYTENDFYVVLGKEKVIEGEVTRERTENKQNREQTGDPERHREAARAAEQDRQNERQRLLRDDGEEERQIPRHPAAAGQIRRQRRDQTGLEGRHRQRPQEPPAPTSPSRTT